MGFFLQNSTLFGSAGKENYYLKILTARKPRREEELRSDNKLGGLNTK